MPKVIKSFRPKRAVKALAFVVSILSLSLSQSGLMAQREPSRGDGKSAANDTVERRLNEKEVARVTRDKRFAAALEVLASQNETVDMKNVRLLTTRSAPDASVTVFNVTVKGTRVPGEFAKLIYMEVKGQEPIVYFDEHQAKKEPVPGTGGCPPGPWKLVGENCGNNWYCSGMKMAVYRLETRTAGCKGEFTQYRRLKIHCHCP